MGGYFWVLACMVIGFLGECDGLVRVERRSRESEYRGFEKESIELGLGREEERGLYFFCICCVFGF